MTLFWHKATLIAASLLLLLRCPAPGQTPAAQAPGASAAPPVRKAAHAAGRKRAAAKLSPAPAPETQPPPAPLAPDQMPPVPPQVTYRNGLLTIVATNSTLSDILHAVSVRTGATVDAPAHLTGERAAARIGPGTPREVLSDLLRGPRFDYILVGSDGDPNGVRSIILTPNQSSPSASAVMAQRQPVRTPPQEEMEEEVGEEQQFPPEPETPQPAQQAMPQPLVPQRQQPFGEGGPGRPAEGYFAPKPQQPQVKTPEQLLEELRRLQQQQGNQQPNPPQQ